MLRRNRKSVLALLLAAVLTLAMLGGCVAKKQVTIVGEVPAPETAAVEAATAPEEAATQQPEQTATPEPQMFPFLEKTGGVTGVSDDPNLIPTSGNEKPTGRYVRVDIACMDGVFSGDHMNTVLKSFQLRDENQTTYPVAFCGFAIAGEFSFDSMEFTIIKPVFDIPVGIEISSLTMLAPGLNEGETIILPLADVPPIQEVSEETEEPETAAPANAEPENVSGLTISEAALSAITESGLYAVPYDESIVFIVNKTTDATVQLQNASDKLLAYRCLMTLDAAQDAQIALQLYQDGVQLLADMTSASLNGGQNTVEVLMKLPESVSGSYRLELRYNGTLVDVQELTN